MDLTEFCNNITTTTTITQLKPPNLPDGRIWLSANQIKIFLSDLHMNDKEQSYSGKIDSSYFWEIDLKKNFKCEFIDINILQEAQNWLSQNYNNYRYICIIPNRRLETCGDGY
jgi:hypothetical protein